MTHLNSRSGKSPGAHERDGENDKSQLRIFKILMKWKYGLQKKKAREEERDFLQFEEIRGGKKPPGDQRRFNTPSTNMSTWSDVWKKTVQTV